MVRVGVDRHYHGHRFQCVTDSPEVLYSITYTVNSCCRHSRIDQGLGQGDDRTYVFGDHCQ
jgi:hypothetical protein